MNRLTLFSGILKPSKFVCVRCRYASVLHAKRPQLPSPLSQCGLLRRHASEQSVSEEKPSESAPSPEESKPKSKPKPKTKPKAKPKAKRKPTPKPRPEPKPKSRSPSTKSRRKKPATVAKGVARRSRPATSGSKDNVADAKSAELKEREGKALADLGSSISTILGAKALRDSEAVVIHGPSLELGVVPVEQPAVPRLAHGLDRVLFNPGVTHVRDPRSRVYNFDPHLEKLMPVEHFDFNSLTLFTPPSKDEVLARIAEQSNKKYVASTSSMTGTLKHFHYLLSRWRPPNFTMLSKSFPSQSTTYTKMTRAPDAVFLRWKDGVYAVDADKMYDSANVLSLMGRYMEKLLTIDRASFDRHRVGSLNPITEQERSEPEAFHYSTHGDFLLRSQLDAQDSRLPGSGMFDLKTRAVVPIRMDSGDYQWGMDYEIRTLLGEWQSFEREYHDMIRSTMMKYSLQVRMGRMDGIFMAYHNIARIFGFQYVSIEEMDRALHGQWDRTLGDQEFLHSLKLMNDIFNRATAKYPEQTLRFHFETREGKRPFMYIFVEPVSEDEANEIQNTNKERIRLWEESILSGKPPEETIRKDIDDVKVGDAAVQDGEDPTSNALQERPEGSENLTGSSDSQGKTSFNGAQDGSSPQDVGNQTASTSTEESSVPARPLLAMVLDVDSYVNGKQTLRPSKLSASDEWNIKYHLVNVESNEKAWTLYNACKLRRHNEMSAEAKRKGDEEDYFRRMLRRITSESRDWREITDREEREAGLEGVVRMWNEDEASTSVASPYLPEDLPLRIRTDAKNAGGPAGDEQRLSKKARQELESVKDNTIAILTAYHEGDSDFYKLMGQDWVERQTQDHRLDSKVQALLDKPAHKQAKSHGKERAAREAAYDLIIDARKGAYVRGTFNMDVWKGVMTKRDGDPTLKEAVA